MVVIPSMRTDLSSNSITIRSDRGGNYICWSITKQCYGSSRCRIFTNLCQCYRHWHVLGIHHQFIYSSATIHRCWTYQPRSNTHSKSILYRNDRIRSSFRISIIRSITGEIMVAIGQPAELKPIVETYCRLLIPYIFICSYDAILVRLIQALDMNISLAICAVLMFASCPLITWFLMYYLDYGWQGTAIAQSVVMLLFFFIMLVLLIYKGYGFIFIPLPFTTVWSLKGIYNYLALALPGLCQNMFEFIIQEAAIVLSGYVASPTTALSATVILNNLFLVVISFSLATCSATNIRVGKYIGKGSIIYAKRAAVGGLMIAALIMSIGSLVLMCGVHVLPRIYTDNVDTIRLTSKIMWILVVFSCGCLMLQTLGGIYRGLGLQKIAAIVVSVSYTLIALPCSIVLLFSFDMRRDLVYGTAIIWGGLAFGNVLGAIVEIIYLWCFGDWKAAVRHANMRIKHTIKEYQSTKRFISVDR
eukprot:312062_1